MYKNKWLIAVAIVVVAGIGYWAFKSNKLSDTNMISSSSPTASPTPVAKVIKTGSAGSTPQTYTQLIVQYANKIVQFDTTCQAHPNYFVLKSGSSIMLDNRSEVTRNVKVGGVAYTLGPWGYKVISLSSPVLPKPIYINCGTSVNVGTVLLEAKISQ